jgi:predicted transcriptional regulator
VISGTKVSSAVLVLVLSCLMIGSNSNPSVCLGSLFLWNPPFLFQSPAIEVAHLGVFHGGEVVVDYVRGGVWYGHTIGNLRQELDYSSLTEAFVGGDSAVVTQVPRYTYLLGQRKRRSRFDLYVCILELLQDHSMTMGEIAFCARLNFSMAKRFIDDLESRGFIEDVKAEEQTIYRLTPPGEALLADLRRIFDKLGKK